MKKKAEKITVAPITLSNKRDTKGRESVSALMLVGRLYPAPTSWTRDLQKRYNVKFGTFFVGTHKTETELVFDEVWGLKDGTAYLVYRAVLVKRKAKQRRKSSGTV